MQDARSHRLAGLAQSDIRAMTRRCTEVGGINLGQGICDLPTPELVREGALEAIRMGRSTYSYSEGIPELREAIGQKLARDNGIQVDGLSQVVVTTGSAAAFVCTIHGVLDPGDGILIPEPYYGYHVNAAIVAGLEVHGMVLEAPEFCLTREALEAALRPNTRALVLCTPGNPSGKMYTRQELEIVDDVAREHDLWVITDEIYEYIRYDGRQHISPATVGSLAERTISIMGLSKTFSITG